VMQSRISDKRICEVRRIFKISNAVHGPQAMTAGSRESGDQQERS
jgi:hypothetical protein